MGVTDPEGDRWPSAILDSWIWSLPHTHFRVLFTCIGIAELEPVTHRSPTWGTVEVPRGGVLTSLARLAERAGVSVSVVRGALANLVRAPDGSPGPVTIASSARGYTLITVPAGWLPAQRQHSATAGAETPIPPPPPSPPARDQHTADHRGNAGSTAASTANVDGGDARPSTAISTPESTAAAQLTIGTEGADLRSDHDQDRDVEDAEADGEEGGDQAKVNARAARIPSRAWQGADYLRGQILEHDPSNVVGRKPWGPEVQRGVRLAWADELRLMVERDQRTFDDIALTIRWLFQGQTEQHRFVVFSAKALREKWDRIQEARRRQRRPAPPPANAPAAAPAAYSNPPERKQWGRTRG